jgi:nicotinate-nucleotide adenylyltransferase
VRIGILGGTFDPIHEGHLHIAREAIRVLKLDKVLFIPVNTSPFKQSEDSAPSHHRLAMTKLAVHDIPQAEVSELEITRGGFSYTIDTLRELKRLYPAGTVFYFLVGADTFSQMASWNEAEKFKDYCQVAVATRPNCTAPLPKNVRLITSEMIPLSSTEIRAELKKGLSPHGVPEAVLDYIRKNHLYP